jgi:class 3 adenylate cyclase
MVKSDKLFEFIGKALESNRDVASLEEELDRGFGETCAPLVLDSTGFTRATQALGTAYFLSIIYQLRNVCEEVFSRLGAIQMRAYADNFFAEFGNVDDAVAAAFAVHKHFADNPVPLLNQQDKFGVCVGIGYGRVLRSEHEGVYGNEMNYASKLGEDIAEAGETLLTQAAFQALSNPESLQVSKTNIGVSGVEMPVYSVRPGTGRG